MLSARLCIHVFHSWLSCAWPVPRVTIPRVIIPRVTIPRVIIPRVTIPCVTQDELHEMCIFHATRKRGPHSHTTGLFKYLS